MTRSKGSSLKPAADCVLRVATEAGVSRSFLPANPVSDSSFSRPTALRQAMLQKLSTSLTLFDVTDLTTFCIKAVAEPFWGRTGFDGDMRVLVARRGAVGP